MIEVYNWYKALEKPDWAPPSYLFAPVWTFLYVIIAGSFGYVFYLYFQKRISGWIVLPFLLNLIFNFIFIPLQFGLRDNFLAAIDILLVFGTLAWAMYAINKIVPWVMYINIPYFLWVCFATVLQITITKLNW